MSSQRNSWEKLCKFRQTMRECRWNICDLVHFWYTQESPEEVTNDPITKGKRRRDLAMAIAGQDGLLREVLTEAITENREKIVDSIAEVLKGELDSLLSLKAFQNFSFSAFDEVNLEDVPRHMMEKAPVLFELLMRLMESPYVLSRSGYKPRDPGRDKKRAFLIASILSNARKPKKSTLLPRAIGLYCHSTGAKRRLLNVLSGLGVIESYMTIRRTLDAAAGKSRVRSI
jgi:hypothetical protein